LSGSQVGTGLVDRACRTLPLGRGWTLDQLRESRLGAPLLSLGSLKRLTRRCQVRVRRTGQQQIKPRLGRPDLGLSRSELLRAWSSLESIERRLLDRKCCFGVRNAALQVTVFHSS
jgi:hypothetical protein